MRPISMRLLAPAQGLAQAQALAQTVQDGELRGMPALPRFSLRELLRRLHLRKLTVPLNLEPRLRLLVAQLQCPQALRKQQEQQLPRSWPLRYQCCRPSCVSNSSRAHLCRS